MSDSRSSVDPRQTGAESALHESERRFRAAFENVGTGMCLTAPDGSLLEVNPALCNMLGRSEGELTSATFASVTHPDDLDVSRECVRALLAGERSVDRFEKRYLRKDGEVVWGDVSTSLFRDANGQPLYFITQIQDVTDRKDAEAQLRRTQGLLSSLIEHAPTPIYANELDSSYRFVNPTWQKFSGFREDDAVGKTVVELFGSAVAERFEDDIRPVVETGGPVAVHESGIYLDLEYHFQTVRFGILDDAGEVEAIGSICVDTTDRMRVESALREGEERFRTAFEHAALGMTLTGVDGRLIKANEAFCRMVGYSQQELPSVSFLDLTHPDDIQMSREVIERLTAGESEAEHLEKRYVRRDGEAVWAEVSVFLLRDAGGVPKHFITHQRDITGRRRTQAALRDSERRFREMAELLPDMVLELDQRLRVTYINLGVSEVLGYTQGDLDAGLTLRDVVDADTLTRMRDEFATAHIVGRPLRGDFDIRCKNGRTIPAEVHAMAIMRSDGELRGYRGVLRDATERVKAQDAQRLAAVGQLAAGVAHEFNNLLATLMLQTDLTAQYATAERYEDLVRTASAVAARGGDICRNLTTFARPEATHREPLYIEAVIESALALAGQQMEAGEVLVTRDYQTNGHRVQADGRHLGQVFLNLFVNACQAMPQGGQLTIEAKHALHAGGTGDIVVTVRDTGMGIEPAHLPRIFEPFFTTKERFGSGGTSGTGLGLSVSHGIVKAHGGKLNVRSEVGEGTTFELVLPSCGDLVAQHGDTAADVTSSPIPTPRTAQVLLAEDGVTLSALIEAILTGSGCKVRCVHAAEEAVSALQADHYDLVVTDLLMPGGGGREVLAYAKSMEQPPPVLVITGTTEIQAEEEVLAMGAGAVLHKPFKGAELTRAVDKLLAEAVSGERYS